MGVWFEGSFDQRSEHWKNQARKFQWLEKWAEKLPTIGKTQLKNSNAWKNGPKNFQPLEKRSSKVPMLGKMGRKTSNHWKNAAQEFQCLEKWAEKLPTIGKMQLKSSNAWKHRKGRHGGLVGCASGRVTAVERVDLRKMRQNYFCY
jgi:hypothetical protein